MAVETQRFDGAGAGPERDSYDPARDLEFPPPDLGPSVHVVGTVVNVHPDETPHPRVRRGEMGRVLFNYGRNVVSNDPLARTNSNRCRDRGNVFTDVLRRGPSGAINPNRTHVKDPKQMSAHITRVAHYFGADVVGIGKSHPALLYAGGTLRDTGFIVDAEEGPHESPQELCRKYPYVLTTPVAWDYELGQRIATTSATPRMTPRSCRRSWC
jgi:hypothetical protein